MDLHKKGYLGSRFSYHGLSYRALLGPRFSPNASMLNSKRKKCESANKHLKSLVATVAVLIEQTSKTAEENLMMHEEMKRDQYDFEKYIIAL
jgi:hypothetical protein